MEFQEILAYKPSVIFTAALLILIAAGGLASFYYYKITSYKSGEADPSEYSLPIIAIAYAAAALFVISGVAFIISNNLSNSNERALVSNIKQKYDVDDVILRNVAETYEGDAIHTNPRKSSFQSLHVVIDGTTYTMAVTQNNKTWEPTLENSRATYEDAIPLEAPIENLLK